MIISSSSSSSNGRLLLTQCLLLFCRNLTTGCGVLPLMMISSCTESRKATAFSLLHSCRHLLVINAITKFPPKLCTTIPICLAKAACLITLSQAQSTCLNPFSFPGIGHITSSSSSLLYNCFCSCCCSFFSNLFLFTVAFPSCCC